MVAHNRGRWGSRTVRTVKPVVCQASAHDALVSGECSPFAGGVSPLGGHEWDECEVVGMSGEDPDLGSGTEDDVAGSGRSGTSGESEAPLADLAADVDARRQRSAGDVFDAAFAEQPYDRLEQGSVWDAVEEDDDSEFGAVGEVIEAGEQTYVVSKRNFCERCRHFSEPPDVHCTHEGTEIREFVDMDHVRLHSCPVVEERGLGGQREGE